MEIVITYLKSLSDIRNDIRKVISETLTSDISETFCISDIQTYCTASFDIRKVANGVGLVSIDYLLQYQTTQLTPIVIADQRQPTVTVIFIITTPYQAFFVIARATLN